MDVKEYTRKILEKSFFGQKDLAELLNVNQSLISLWRSGERQISSDHFLMLLDVLGYSRYDYLNENVEPKIRLCFKANSISSKEDLQCISKLNKIAANLSLMEDLLQDESIKY